MTFEEYEKGYYEGDSGGLPEPPRDPEEQAMIEHIVEFETEMFRLDCQRKYSRLNARHLQKLMIEIHGEDWRDAL
jgi:hypothetical protein